MPLRPRGRRTVPPPHSVVGSPRLAGPRHHRAHRRTPGRATAGDPERTTPPIPLRASRDLRLVARPRSPARMPARQPVMVRSRRKAITSHGAPTTLVFLRTRAPSVPYARRPHTVPAIHSASWPSDMSDQQHHDDHDDEQGQCCSQSYREWSQRSPRALAADNRSSCERQRSGSDELLRNGWRCSVDVPRGKTSDVPPGCKIVPDVHRWASSRRAEYGQEVLQLVPLVTRRQLLAGHVWLESRLGPSMSRFTIPHCAGDGTQGHTRLSAQRRKRMNKVFLVDHLRKVRWRRDPNVEMACQLSLSLRADLAVL